MFHITVCGAIRNTNKGAGKYFRDDATSNSIMIRPKIRPGFAPNLFLEFGIRNRKDSIIFAYDSGWTRIPKKGIGLITTPHNQLTWTADSNVQPDRCMRPWAAHGPGRRGGRAWTGDGQSSPEEGRPAA